MLTRSPPNCYQQYAADVAALPPDDPPGEWCWEEWNKNAIKSRLRRADLKAHKRDPLVPLRHKLPVSVIEEIRKRVQRPSPQDRDRVRTPEQVKADNVEMLHQFITLALRELKPLKPL